MWENLNGRLALSIMLLIWASLVLLAMLYYWLRSMQKGAGGAQLVFTSPPPAKALPSPFRDPSPPLAAEIAQFNPLAPALRVPETERLAEPHTEPPLPEGDGDGARAAFILGGALVEPLDGGKDGVHGAALPLAGGGVGEALAVMEPLAEGQREAVGLPVTVPEGGLQALLPLPEPHTLGLAESEGGREAAVQLPFLP